MSIFWPKLEKITSLINYFIKLQTNLIHKVKNYYFLQTKESFFFVFFFFIRLIPVKCTGVEYRVVQYRVLV